jgi:hypothetical protein
LEQLPPLLQLLPLLPKVVELDIMMTTLTTTTTNQRKTKVNRKKKIMTRREAMVGMPTKMILRTVTEGVDGATTKMSPRIAIVGTEMVEVENMMMRTMTTTGTKTKRKRKTNIWWYGKMESAGTWFTAIES